MGSLRSNDAHQQAASLLSGDSQTSCDTGVSLLRVAPRKALRIPSALKLCKVTTDLGPGKEFRYSDCHSDTRFHADQAHDPASPSTASSRGRGFEGRASLFDIFLTDSMLPLPEDIGVLTPLQTYESRPGWQQDRQKSRARKSTRGSSPDHKRARAAMSVDVSSCTWDGVGASSDDENVFMLPLSPRDEAATPMVTSSKYRAESPPPDRIIRPLSSPPPMRRAPVRSLSPLPDSTRWQRRLPDLFNSPDECQILHPAGVPPELPHVEPLHPIDACSADGKKRLGVNSANVLASTADTTVGLGILQIAEVLGSSTPQM